MTRILAEAQTPRYAFFLGGHDLEMLAIRELVERHSNAAVHDKGLSWGAKASDYAEEIDGALANGETPVLVELDMDLSPPPDGIIVVDHHGEIAGHETPTSLEQVFRLLGLSDTLWSRHLQLVAANDRGYIPAMRELGASVDEINEIRRLDRSAQGITEEEERAAEAALASVETRFGGKLTLARLSHGKTAALVDRIQTSGDDHDNLLVLSPGEVNFFGDGEVVSRLAVAYPQGWYGGDLPQRGYWGATMGEDEVPNLLSEMGRLFTRDETSS